MSYCSSIYHKTCEILYYSCAFAHRLPKINICKKKKSLIETVVTKNAKKHDFVTNALSMKWQKKKKKYQSHHQQVWQAHELRVDLHIAIFQRPAITMFMTNKWMNVAKKDLQYSENRATIHWLFERLHCNSARQYAVEA